jgi:hypothetical protein
MHALTSMHGWGWLLVIAGIFGWSALMLLLVYLLTKLWRPRTPSPAPTQVPVRPRDWTRG